LIAVAGVLAGIAGIDMRPLGPALVSQFAANGLLLFFATAVLDAIAQALFFFRRAQDALDAPAPARNGYLTTVPVKERGRVTILELAQVGWIESQGNYLALHAGAVEHLIRATSIGFESSLDPERFVRIHRQTIVALDRIREIATLPSGDATVTLDDGTELRMSRAYREAVRAKIEKR
jgi:DNA-binding LytR/AlgR family response regulator